jgi:hypothetical protein
MWRVDTLAELWLGFVTVTAHDLPIRCWMELVKRPLPNAPVV